ncbi:hypothetical protein [Streptomyces toxytricini]|uniref:Uncharacterized protein n=1 Tax=Streptomyces toxytricini TaxID=67369 RepID=A0ABW8ETI1_STRT5
MLPLGGPGNFCERAPRSLTINLITGAVATVLALVAASGARDRADHGSRAGSRDHRMVPGAL